jgi:glycosyltransferase involved in cell wall biosynthesis
MREIIFSIIIPHKNIPDLLQRCLDSIPRREDIQIIVVDDNSDENKVDFSRFPGLEDKYVEVYLTKEGRGAGYARNVGLEHAKGKWLLFADADDFFNIGFLSVLDKYYNTNYDIIYFSATSVNSDTGELAFRNKRLIKIIENYNDKLLDKDDLIYMNWEPWSKLFNYEFVVRNSLKFEEVKVGNDALFVIQAGERASRLVVDKSPIYCVTYSKNSLTFKLKNEKEFDERVAAKIRINNYLQKKNKIKYKIPLGADIILSIKFGLNKFFKTIKTAKQNKNKISIKDFKSIGGLIIRYFYN